MVNTVKYCKKIDQTPFNTLTFFYEYYKSNEELYASLGGASRLPKIQNFLSDLRNRSIAVKILSTTWFPITENQWQEYLFYVTNLLNLGFKKEDILAVEDPGPGLPANKGERIREDQNTKAFQNQVIFADESTGSINSALNVSNLLWMKEGTGLGEEDMEFITKSTR